MKLAIVAGEASGDLHAAKVVHELKALDPGLATFGIGGDLLAEEGMELLHHAREMGVVGLFNVLRHLRFFRRVFDELMARIERDRPDAVMLVDYPEFNLRVARRCREVGVKVLYYISPQIWAWRRGRVKKIARLVDRMLVIFPFEEDFYRKHDVPVAYVGHPLIDELHEMVGLEVPGSGSRVPASGAEIRDALSGISKPGPGAEIRDPAPGTRDPAKLTIALLPGSRRHEVHALLPPMLDAVAELQRDREVDAFVIQAPTISGAELLAHMTAAHKFVRVVPYDGGLSLAGADVALSSSGTATLEAAIVDTPVVVMYRLSPLTYVMAQLLVKVQHFSLVNIVAGREVVPELIQRDVNGIRIAAEVRALLDPAANAHLREGLALVRERLGGRGASRRAAEEIFRMLGNDA
jgi:lipid-A-disaccharide synthase